MSLQPLPQSSFATCKLPNFMESSRSAVDAWRPKRKLNLGMLNTPAYPWFQYGDFEIYVKRDDLTGCELSGNKVRKLEYLLSEAIEQGCQAVITSGCMQSNHCRATAACAARLGIECHLFLRSANLEAFDDVTQIPLHGNALLDYLFNAHVYFVSVAEPDDTHLEPRIQQLASELRHDKGLSAYIIPPGGSNAVGSLGYVEAYDEMLRMKQLDHITDIFFACGSGGTAAGLAIANYLFNPPSRQQQRQQHQPDDAGDNKRFPRVPQRAVHAVSICDNADFFYQHVQKIMSAYGLPNDLNARGILNVIDGYKAPGYGKSTREHLELIQQVSSTTGIVLDPTFTGKAVYGILKEIDKINSNMIKSPQQTIFAGKKLLFIMTGGVFANFDGRWNDERLLSASKRSSRMQICRPFTNIAEKMPPANTPNLSNGSIRRSTDDAADSHNRGALLERGARFLIDEWRRMQPLSNEKTASGRDQGDKVLKFTHPQDLQKVLNLAIRNEADSNDEIMNLCSTVAEYSLKCSNAHNYNQLWHGVDEPGLLGAWFTDTFNTQAFTYEVAPAFSLIENFLLEHIGSTLIGYDRDQVEGTMCPGGSLANMYALSLARHAKRPETKVEGMAQSAATTLSDESNRGKLVGFTSVDSHYSLKKGMSFMGFGSENLIAVECDQQGRMRVDKLEEAVQACRSAGSTPFFVNATSGSTVLGAFDPLDMLADVCRRHRMWLHCDAAWGGAALLVPRLRQKLLRGIELCDSVLWNPHKMLCLPLQCSVFVTRHRGALSAAHSTKASYLFQPDKFYDTSFDTGDKVIQCGRHVDAFKLYLKWRALGASGLQKEVERAFEMAAVLAELVDRHENFELVLPYSEEQCTNVCFWYVPPAFREKWKLEAKGGVRKSVEREQKIGGDGGKMREFETALHLLAPEIKKRLMLEGSLMVGYQPDTALNLPNFFRMVVQCVPHQTVSDMRFVVEEIDRLGRNIDI